MRHLTNIAKHCTRIAALAVIAAALPGCSTTDGPGYGDSDVYSPLMPVSGFMSGLTSAATSRGYDDPFVAGGRTFYFFDYLYPNPVNLSMINIAAILVPADGSAATIGSFAYKGEGKWNTSLNVREDTDYYLFGFMPGTVSGDSEIQIAKRSDGLGGELDYLHGAVITVTNFPSISSADVSTVVGIYKATSATPEADAAVAGLKDNYGSYDYHGTTDNYVCLLLDHLYANVNFEMYVDKAYSELRKFEITGAEMTSNTSTLVDLSVEVGNSEAESLDPVKSITYTNSLGSPAVVTQLFPLPGSSAETTLMVEPEVDNPAFQTYTSIPGYFVPANDKQVFYFTFTYNVYDSDGRLVRRNCSATNSWSISSVQSGGEKLAHGVSYRIKVKIKPTYLYQLNEPDLDNPTLEIIP